MTNQFIFDIANKYNWRQLKQELGRAIQELMDNAKTSLVVIVDEHKERSPKALRGYWRLIGVITKHLNVDSDYIWQDEEVSDMFKENIGFTYKVDKMLFWKQKYKEELKKGTRIVCQAGIKCFLVDDDIYDKLGFRYKIKTRSLKKNKGCTREDMEKLIGEVLRFGAGIPDCELRNEEQREFDKYYESQK